MKANESSFDRLIRIILGIVLIILGWFALGNNTSGVILDIIGIILIITGITGYCWIYTVLGTRTKKEPPA